MKVIPPMEIADAGGSYSRAGPATFTGRAGGVQTAPAGVLRIRYDAKTGANLGALIEGAGANLLAFSEAFTDASWFKSAGLDVTTGAASIAAPDTAKLAGLVLEGTTTQNYVGRSTSSAMVAGQEYTLSAYGKRYATGTARQLSLIGTGNFGTAAVTNQIVVYDLDTQVCTSISGASAFGIEYVGDGWYRCWIRMRAFANGTGDVQLRLARANNISYTPDGTNAGLYLWGAMFDQGPISSYIPRPTAAAATRAADVYTGTGLLYTTVPEDDAAEWSSGTAYAVGARVIRKTTHHVYEAATTSTGKVPENNLTGTTPAWLDLGSTNRWRMLRTDSNAQTTGASAMTIAVRFPKRVQGIGLLRVDADRITVSSSDGYSATQDLRKRYTQGWFDYFYGQLRFRTVGLFLDLPRSSSSTVFTVTIERLSGGPVSCGPVVFGNPVDMGEVQDGAEYGIRDFSTVSRDTFGNATLIRRKRIPSTSQRTLLDKDQVEVVQQTLNDLTASVGLWFGLEDPADGYFSSLAVLGLITNSKLTLQSTYAALALDLEGL